VTDSNQVKIGITAVSATILGICMAMLLDGIVDPVLVWGGTEIVEMGSSTVQVGYPPFGILFVLFFSVAVTAALTQILHSLLKRLRGGSEE